MIIVLKDANFANANLGQLEIPTANLVSLAILGADTVEGVSSSYTCRATYDDNTTREVTSLVSWSVASDTYATISNGVLSIKSAASSPQDVQIIASLNSISTSKTVSVKWTDTIDSEAQTILEAYGNKVLTSEQRHAFADFYTEFNAASWSSKIRFMIIPALCVQKDKLAYVSDVNQSGALFDIISKSNKSLSSGTFYNVSGNETRGCLKVGDYGLQKYIDGSQQFSTNFKVYFDVSNLTVSNFSVLYGIRSISSTGFTTEASATRSLKYKSGRVYSEILHDNGSIVSQEANGVIAGQNVLSANDGNTQEYLVYGKAGDNVNGVTTNYTVSESALGNSISSIGINGGSNLSDGSLSFLALGEGLERNDYLTFVSMVQDLLEALGVIETEQSS